MKGRNNNVQIKQVVIPEMPSAAATSLFVAFFGL
jgi:hypothetical protein